ncbi:MAG: hypothetical protein JO336_12470 [Acidobacteriia bacterium]|nr:hypothetical protein [Terriglobia bacterium]
MRTLLFPEAFPPAICLYGETTGGSILGDVTDPQDLPVPLAQIELVNEGTRTRAIVRTSAARPNTGSPTWTPAAIN